MSTQTPNYNLIKPAYTDPVDVKDLNDNADIIDSTLAAKANLVGGKVPASELPSYVDDVIEGYYYEGDFYEDSAHTTPIAGEAGKIYIDLDTENCYRWSGSVFIQISSASSEFIEVYKRDGGLDYSLFSPAELLQMLADGIGMTYKSRIIFDVIDVSGDARILTWAGKNMLAADVTSTQTYGMYRVTESYYGSVFETAEKTKLTGIEAGAEVNDIIDVQDSQGNSLVNNRIATIPVSPGSTITDVQVNGTSVVNVQGVAEVTVPVQGTITSGSTGYATGGDVYTYVDTLVGNADTLLGSGVIS